jgi:hypothetical protein
LGGYNNLLKRDISNTKVVPYFTDYGYYNINVYSLYVGSFNTMLNYFHFDFKKGTILDTGTTIMLANKSVYEFFYFIQAKSPSFFLNTVK